MAGRWSSIAARWYHQAAMRQHREMVDAYESAGVKVHLLPGSEYHPYGVYARDSSFMTPVQLGHRRTTSEAALSH